MIDGVCSCGLTDVGLMSRHVLRIYFTGADCSKACKLNRSLTKYFKSNVFLSIVSIFQHTFFVIHIHLCTFIHMSYLKQFYNIINLYIFNILDLSCRLVY